LLLGGSLGDDAVHYVGGDVAEFDVGADPF
jgi:hypothetical protein